VACTNIASLPSGQIHLTIGGQTPDDAGDRRSQSHRTGGNLLSAHCLARLFVGLQSLQCLIEDNWGDVRIRFEGSEVGSSLEAAVENPGNFAIAALLSRCRADDLASRYPAAHGGQRELDRAFQWHAQGSKARIDIGVAAGAHQLLAHNDVKGKNDGQQANDTQRVFQGSLLQLILS
jgi:hypothetical protein